MDLRTVTRSINASFINLFLSTEEKSDFEIDSPQRILIIRQHNQFGDMLATVPLFRAIKEKYPFCELTVVASPANYRALEGNPLIDKLFVYEQKKILNSVYRHEFRKLLRRNYDIAIVPVTVAISNTSCIFAALSDAKIKIGPRSLNGKNNSLKKLFNYRINLDWRKYPDAHVSDFIQDIVRQFGISTKNFSSIVEYNEEDIKVADEFISSIGKKQDDLLIGLHIGAAKAQNRWSLEKYIELINEINKNYNAKFYFTGSKADKEQLDYMKNNCKTPVGQYVTQIAPLAAIISKSNLFVTNDTGVMHVAGTLKTPQISLFGQTNPFNWAPVGQNKYFIRKSELIDDISVSDVFNLVQYVLGKPKK
jgi:heptosyltransferase II